MTTKQWVQTLVTGVAALLLAGCTSLYTSPLVGTEGTEFPLPDPGAAKSRTTLAASLKTAVSGYGADDSTRSLRATLQGATLVPLSPTLALFGGAGATGFVGLTALDSQHADPSLLSSLGVEAIVKPGVAVAFPHLRNLTTLNLAIAQEYGPLRDQRATLATYDDGNRGWRAGKINTSTTGLTLTGFLESMTWAEYGDDLWLGFGLGLGVGFTDVPRAVTGQYLDKLTLRLDHGGVWYWITYEALLDVKSSLGLGWGMALGTWD